MFIPSQKKADLAPKFQEVGETKRGASWPMMKPQATYIPRPRTIVFARSRALGSSPDMA